MPDWLTQRRFPRYTIYLPFAQKAGVPAAGGTAVGWTRNLSEGGGCLELAECLKPQTPLRIRLQTDRGPLTIGGLVVWTGDPARAGGGVRHGVIFTQVPPDQRQALRTLVARRAQGTDAKVRLPFEVGVTCQRKGQQEEPPLQGQTGDVSREGLLLLLPEVLPEGTALELTLHTPTGPLTAAGEIVWVESPGGRLLGPPYRHGLQFRTVGWSTLLSLGLLLTEPT